MPKACPYKLPDYTILCRAKAPDFRLDPIIILNIKAPETSSRFPGPCLSYPNLSEFIRAYQTLSELSASALYHLRRRTERTAFDDEDFGAFALRTLVFLVALGFLASFFSEARVAEPRRERTERLLTASSSPFPSRLAISSPSALAAASASAASRASRAAITSSREGTQRFLSNVSRRF